MIHPVLFFNTFFNHLTIRKKLILSYLIVGIVILSASYYSYFDTTKSAIIARTHNQLSSVMNLKKGWLESYLENQKILVQHFSTYCATQLSSGEFDTSFRKYSTNGKAYCAADSLLSKFIQSNQFENLWLINKDGQIIYTTKQNGNLGRNINDTDFYNLNLKQALSNNKQKVYIMDMTYLSQAQQNPTLMIISPIYNTSELLLGYILLEMNFNEINSILAKRTGLGQTGESYVVDEKYTMRSLSRFTDEQKAVQIKVSTAGVNLALVGKGGKGIFKDYRNVEVLSCFSRIKIDGVKWALLSEIDVKEAMLPVYELNRKMIIVGVILANILILTAIYLAGKISDPIKIINGKIRQLSKGNLPESYIEIENKDEIGQIARSVNQLVNEFRKTTDFAKEIGSGNFSVKYTPLSNSDVLGFSLLEMRDRLAELSEIVTQQNRLKTISLVEGQENERIRISRELHDGVGQMLTALKFKIQELEANNPIVVSTKQLLDETINEVRRVAVNLVPSVLYDFGIEAAIKILIKNVDLNIDFTANKSENALEPDLEKRICLYRITQEAIQNIQKYAHTSKVRIHLEFSKEGTDLIIMDYGIGFNTSFEAKENMQSNGLRNMKERAYLVGGSFEIESEKGKGTKIVVNIPA